MKSISAEPWQLLSFFESEPELLDPAEHWCFNDAACKTRDGVVELSFAVAPAHRDVRIILQQDGHVLYELNAMGVRDVAFTKEYGIEELHVAITADEKIVLRVKPRISITHKLADGDR
jgi:hypothetical protein